MRVTADTNIVISGLFWRGNPRRVLDAARDGIIQLFTTEILLAELDAVLRREKFAIRLSSASVSVGDLVDGYAALAEIVVPARISPVVIRDPDDDAVIACAVAADCDHIVSKDEDLLSLEEYQTIQIVNAEKLLARLRLR